MGILKKIEAHFEEYLSVFLLSLMTILIFLQIIFRFVLNLSLDWTEEIARYTFVWLVYMSASLAVKSNSHIRVEAVEKLLPKTPSKWFGFLAELVWLLFTLTMVKQGYIVAMKNWVMGQTSPAVHFPMGVIYSIIPIGFTLISLRIIQRMVKRFRRNEETEEQILM